MIDSRISRPALTGWLVATVLAVALFVVKQKRPDPRPTYSDEGVSRHRDPIILFYDAGPMMGVGYDYSVSPPICTVHIGNDQFEVSENEATNFASVVREHYRRNALGLSGK